MVPTRLAKVALLFLLVGVVSTPGQTDEPPQSGAQTAAHILDYVSLDYPGCVRDGTVVNAAEYREQQEFCAEALVAVRKLRPASDDLIRRVVLLGKAIEQKDSAQVVSAQAASLRAAILDRYRSSTAPVTLPDLDKAAALFGSRCSVCHGLEGRGDGPASRSLEPAPSSFLNQDRMDQRSVYSVFSVISLGVKGTAMAAFPDLSESDRWSLAFYVSSLRFSSGEMEQGRKAWEDESEHAFFHSLGQLTETPLSAWKGARRLVGAWLLRHPDKILAREITPLALSRLKLKQASEVYGAGDGHQALTLLISAYLEGYELEERRLAQLDGNLASQIEAKMLGLRELVRANKPVAEFRQSLDEVDFLLSQAQEELKNSVASPWATFAASFLLLLREGLEAVLVLAGLMAVLRKAGRGDALRYVHLGWIAACALGLLTWFLAGFLLKSSGASREVAEGFTALFAAVTLLYVGLWLHGKAQAGAWQRYLRDSIQSALSGGTLWALTSISFLAVYREVFELVLFYQAMWLAGQSGSSSAHTALLAGMACGVVALVAAGWSILRLSARLPLGIFFNLAGISLSLLAIVFLGNAVAAFQEAGWLSATRLPIFTNTFFGLRPTSESMLIQLPVTLGLAALLIWQQRKPAGGRT
jgi:high-affinity iron transporter